MGKAVGIFRSFIILLIGICLFMPIIYSIHFYFNRALHRMEMWEIAESKQFQTIEMDSATIHWTKKSRELIVRGAYFDVVSVSYHNGRAIIKGIFDNEETEMHEAFARYQQTESEPESNTQKVADWLLHLWTFNDNQALHYLDWGFPLEFTLPKSASIISKVMQPPVPPPWKC